MANRFVLDYDDTSSPLSSGVEQTPPSQQRKPLFTFPASSNLSSTPAGPPPSQKPLFSDRPAHFSTTPAGPPPSSIYGGSGLGGRKLQFKPPADSPSTKNIQSTDSRPLPPRTANGTPARPKSKAGPGFASGPTSTRAIFAGSDRFRSGTGFGDSMVSMEEEQDDEDTSEPPAFNSSARFNFNATSRSQPPFLRSSQATPARPASRKKALLPKPSRLPSKGNEDIIPGIARTLASNSAEALLEEPDDLVIKTEDSMQELAEWKREDRGDEAMAHKISKSIASLIVFWGGFVHPDKPQVSNARVGPLDSASGLEKANYLASLLLMLHHRPPVVEKATKKSQSTSMILTRSKPAPVPLVLLDWLDNYHVSYDEQFVAILHYGPNCTASKYFWDIVRCLVMRGKLPKVIELFENADFQYAETAKDEGGADGAESGYHGAQLQTIHSVINRARQILSVCPSMDGHWDTSDDEWDLYRKRVAVEIEHLVELAEDDIDDDEEDDFRADNFGARTGGSLMRSMRGNAHQLPLTVYTELKWMYGIMLGSTEEIIGQSSDWLEAATSLTIWWDGSEQDEITSWSKKVGLSNAYSENLDDDTYLFRLRAAFLCVTDPESRSSLQLNTMSAVEVGMGAVLQEDHASVLRLLRTFSLPVASVVVEIGTASGWLTGARSSGHDMLDEEDLMVLSYAAPPSGVSKDDILSEFAEALFGQVSLRSKEGENVEGWELALSVVSRFDSATLIKSTTSDFLDHFNLNSQERMDKLVGLCSGLGLEDEAQKVCEKYADHLVNNTSDYGTALLCYARSHASNKLRQVMDLLVSYCLVQSKAYPPEEEMDDDLRALVSSPKNALAGLVQADPEAADMLQFYLVGYACVRRFYNMRDDEVTAAKNKTQPTHRPIARRRLAAKALLAAIASAADSIYGGLYDSSRHSAIQLDGLLPLLGEATAFLANEERKAILTTSQLCALLAAIEDLQTVNPRIYDATEECLQAALRQYHGSRPPSPRAMLKKSVSSGTGSNFSFSMMGSEMLAGSGTSFGGKSDGSAVLIGRGTTRNGNGDQDERGWDWRAGFKERGANGESVLRRLRLGIARELSVSELDD